jgi:hypothetical protein
MKISDKSTIYLLINWVEDVIVEALGSRAEDAAGDHLARLRVPWMHSLWGDSPWVQTTLKQRLVLGCNGYFVGEYDLIWVCPKMGD